PAQGQSRVSRDATLGTEGHKIHTLKGLHTGKDAGIARAIAVVSRLYIAPSGHHHRGGASPRVASREARD
ncbi:MAG: hypothetical protein WAW37_20360, partial [Syntrophobacteraceae bacterium]